MSIYIVGAIICGMDPTSEKRVAKEWLLKSQLSLPKRNGMEWIGIKDKKTNGSKINLGLLVNFQRPWLQ